MQMPQIATPDTDNYKSPSHHWKPNKNCKILDKFTELEATLEAELALRKRQYRYYRDLLLDLTIKSGGIADGYQCRLKMWFGRRWGRFVKILIQCVNPLLVILERLEMYLTMVLLE
ncbi:putative type I specificity subunit HsdS [Neisseria gonorrhoeae]|uniref:Putative type I specificity subunit HsdS n=1 Tax=Neisseria gonorrhoeae TaxID=485 RepID=A0A378VYJ4_NEIGO|nr:putative type I specificity subunit HsdS [Neisseria gonorrhoeae]